MVAPDSPVPIEGSDTLIRPERSGVEFETLWRIVADGPHSSSTQVEAPGLALERLTRRESGTRQKGDIDASRLADRPVADRVHAGRSSGLGEVLAGGVVDRVRPACRLAVERRCSKVQPRPSSKTHRKRRVLAGVGGSRRVA